MAAATVGSVPWSRLLLLSGRSRQSFPEGSFWRGQAWHGLQVSWQHPPALPFQAGDFPAGMKLVGAVGPAATPCSREMPPLPKPPGKGCCPVWTSGLQGAGLLFGCAVVPCEVFSTLQAPGTRKPPGCWGSGALPAPTAPGAATLSSAAASISPRQHRPGAAETRLRDEA